MIFLATGCAKESTKYEITKDFIEIVDMAGRNVTIPAKVDTIFFYWSSRYYFDIFIKSR